ncbi:hypothetical protein C8F01DRAFT_1087358 [Mycena amicta]|nr:hypothetical protein C8F01DRAFT_1087358 [Mycena amicta]
MASTDPMLALASLPGARSSFASTSGSTSPPSPAPTSSSPTSPEGPTDATSWDVIALDSIPIPWPDQDNISPQAARWPAFPSGSFQGSHPQYSPQYTYSTHYPQVALHYPGGNPYAIEPISSQWAPLPNMQWAAAWDVPPHPPRSNVFVGDVRPESASVYHNQPWVWVPEFLHKYASDPDP